MKDNIKKPDSFNCCEDLQPWMLQMMQDCCSKEEIRQCMESMKRMFSEEECSALPRNRKMGKADVKKCQLFNKLNP